MSNHGLNNPGGCFYHHCSAVNIVANDDLGVTQPADLSSPPDMATIDVTMPTGCSCNMGGAPIAGGTSTGILAVLFRENALVGGAMTIFCIAALVVFSSIAGRFGNGGQTDYCAANDLLCKLTLHLQRVRPELRGLALDWTAWGGIGMAARGSIPKLMELAGIDMLPPAAGVPIVRHELTTGGARGEVVIGQRLGVMTAEWDAQGGLEPTSVPAASGPMLGRVVGMGLFSGLTVEVLLDPKQQAFLHDHQIEGTAVLLPVDPDRSARGIQARVAAATLLGGLRWGHNSRGVATQVVRAPGGKRQPFSPGPILAKIKSCKPHGGDAGRAAS